MKFFVSGYKYNDLIKITNFTNLLKMFSPTCCYEGIRNGIEDIIDVILYKNAEKDGFYLNFVYIVYTGMYKNFIDDSKPHNRYLIYDFKFYNILDLFIKCFNYIEDANITYNLISGYDPKTNSELENKIILKDEYNRQNMIELDNCCKRMFIERKVCKNFPYLYEVSINYINDLKKYEIPDEIVDMKISEYKFPFSDIDIQDIKNIEEKKSINNIDLIDITIDEYFRKYKKYILTKRHLLYEYMDKNISNLIIEYCRFEKNLFL